MREYFREAKDPADFLLYVWKVVKYGVPIYAKFENDNIIATYGYDGEIVDIIYSETAGEIAAYEIK